MVRLQKKLTAKLTALISISGLMLVGLLFFQNCTKSPQTPISATPTLNPATITAIDEVQEKIACVPGTEIPCSSTSKKGMKTCLSDGSGYGTCEYTDCANGYEAVGHECVTSCIPGARVSCDDKSGIGTKACNSRGTLYGQCQFTNCFPPYVLDKQTKTCYLKTACGASASTALQGTPQPDQLCARGTASEVTRYGSYVWEWNCHSGPSKTNCQAWSGTPVKCSHIAGFNNGDSLYFPDTIEFLTDEVMTAHQCYESFVKKQEDTYKAQALARCPRLPFYTAKFTNINYFFRLNDEDQTQSLFIDVCE